MHGEGSVSYALAAERSWATAHMRVRDARNDTPAGVIASPDGHEVRF
jgi:hypothetical protein